MEKMSVEENIKQKLIEKFPCLEGNIRIPRQRRIFLDIALENFQGLLGYAVNELKFTHLCTITGLDEQDKLGVIYHLAQDSGITLNIKTGTAKDNPVLRSVIPYFRGAEIYERELVDLFGAKVDGLPPGPRYPLTDGWPENQFPLRKDWKAASQDEKNAG